MPRQQPGYEQGGGATMLDLGAAAGDLVHRAEGHAAAGQVPVDGVEPERQRGAGRHTATAMLEGRDPRAEGHDRIALHAALPLVHTARLPWPDSSR